MSVLTIDFCGEIYTPKVDEPFTIGRDADLVLDGENPFLHRVFLVVKYYRDLWWLENAGGSLSATVADSDSGAQSWLPPQATLPLVFSSMVVWFTAGETTYEFELFQEEALYNSVTLAMPEQGDKTIGAISLTADQRLLLVALAEDVLKRGKNGSGTVPSSKEAAYRLGWELTKINRKLDNVCSKFADVGVRGLHGGPGRLAISRKARLVEYVLGTGVITQTDLELLPPRSG